MSQDEDNPTAPPAAAEIAGSPSINGEASQPKPQALAPIERYALTVANPTVRAVALRFGWNPKTLVVRVERAIPAKFEQQIYLSVAESFRIYPESLAKLLAIYRDDQSLSPEDLKHRSVGENVISNRFGEFSDFLSACMNLVKVITKEYRAFALTMELAATIVLAYGTENPEQVIEMIDNNLDECCEFFEISEARAYSERMRLCTWLYMTKILPELQRRGVPNPLDPAEFIGDRTLLRYHLGEDLDAHDLAFEKELRNLLEGREIL